MNIHFGLLISLIFHADSVYSSLALEEYKIALSFYDLGSSEILTT